MLDRTEVLRNFPCPSFRKHQKEVLEQITQDVNSGYKCFLLDCPTGFGKSPLNVALGRSFNKSFYMTPQLTLIDQLRNDKYCGSYLTEIKGKSNYQCIKDTKLTCDVCLKKVKPTTECDEKTQCPYHIQKSAAFNSQILLTSFAYFSLVSSGKSFKNRELMIIDEAHNISEDTVKNMSIIISPHTIPLDIFKIHQSAIDGIKQKDDFAEYPELGSLLESLEATCATKIEENLNEISSLEDTAENPKTIEKIRSLGRENRHLEDFASKISNYLNDSGEEHAFRVDKQGYYGQIFSRITIQPIYARRFMPKKLWNKAEYFVLSSATLMDINLFIQETGLDEIFDNDTIKHITVPSTFPTENRPIINASIGKITYENKDTLIPLAIKRVEEILDIEKGNVAIHCHSYENSEAIQFKISPKYRSRLISHDAGNRQEQLEIWKTKRDKVFLSVNFEEGQDWVGDICTAQILFKVPYLNLGDKRTRIRLNGKHENAWYYNETLKKVIQSYGRAVRTEQDKASFYVIDESFFHLLGKSNSIPVFFAESPLKTWEEWKQRQVPQLRQQRYDGQVCGNCNNYENNCSKSGQVKFQPITPSQWATNVSSVGSHSSLAENCQNFGGLN